MSHDACRWQRKLKRNENERLKYANVAESVVTEWALLVVFFPKEDESLRLWVDYRRLDSVTVRYIIPFLVLISALTCQSKPDETRMFLI